MVDSVTPGPPGNILIVDDTPANLLVLAQMLKERGYKARPVPSGPLALDAARREPPDLILLDISMPEMDGYEVCRRLKNDPALRDIPVIFISALTETPDKVKGFQAGGVDYVTKPFQFEEVRARVETHLTLRKCQREIEEQNRKLTTLLEEVRAGHETIAAQLARASAYVLSLIPPPILSGPVRTDWRMVPCTQLGGDALGYDRLDATHLAVYLLDVSSHGVGPALLSVSVLNRLRARSLPGADFHHPDQVLAALNAAFPMEEHDGMYFTIWYGVIDTETGALRYAAGGHPPALLVGPDGTTALLDAPGPSMGWFPEADCPVRSVRMERSARLYLFSDGCYEVTKPDGSVQSDLKLPESFLAAASSATSEMDLLRERLLAIRGQPTLGDDFSILRVDRA